MISAPKNVLAADDFVGHDPQIGLQLVVVAAQLVQRHHGAVAGAIGVMHRGAIDRLAVLPDGELVGDA